MEEVGVGIMGTMGRGTEGIETGEEGIVEGLGIGMTMGLGTGTVDLITKGEVGIGTEGDVSTEERT